MLTDRVVSRLALLLAMLLLCIPGRAQVIISEFMASNTRGLQDEDREYPDWIELSNVGAVAINLNGWGLTDTPASPRKWKFPSVDLGVGASLVVFASGKDRRIANAPLHTNFKLSSTGDYLGLSDDTGAIVFEYAPHYPPQIPDVSFGVLWDTEEFSLLSPDAANSFLVPRDNSLEEIWNNADFDSSSWTAGEGAIGFNVSNGDPSIIKTDVRAEMLGHNSSVYLRIPFDASRTDLASLLLRVNYADAFVAFLNGVEVARANFDGDPLWNSTAATNRAPSAAINTEEFDLSPSSGLLHPGTNVLALQGINFSVTEGDFLLRAELRATRSEIKTNAWRYFLQPTPRQPNGSGDTNVGPLVLETSFAPRDPKPGDDIAVSVRVLPTLNPVANLSLAYRMMFGAETNRAMFDDGLHGDGAAGDGVFGVTIPAAAAAGQMVRWYVRATDEMGLSTRWPAYRDSRNSPQYLGTVVSDPSLTNRLPVLHWFLQSPTAADGSAGTRCSLFWNGTFYDNVFANIHGQSSQGFPKKSYNLNFNTGYHLHYADAKTAVGKINLLTTYPDKAHLRNVLAYETFRDAGHPYHFVMPVRVQRNGAFFSDAHLVEDGDEDYLQRVGLDPRGALYKMYNTLDSSSSGVEKRTRTFEGNADLTALIRGLALSGTNRLNFIYDNVNLAGMANYLAAMIVTGNVDCCHKNYYLYRDSDGTGEWEFLPWDLDLSFGRNWTGAKAYFDDTMYVSNGLYVGSNNALPAALFALPEFKQMYLRRLRTLMDDLMQPPGTPAADLKYENRIDGLYAAIGPDAAHDFAKWPTWGIKQTMPEAINILKTQYLPQRRNYLFNSLKTTIPPSLTNRIEIGFGPFEFNPPSGSQSEEYLSVTNATAAAVDLSGWRISGAVSHQLAPGTVLPPRSTLYLSPDVKAFRRRKSGPSGGRGLFVQGNYNGQLSARGETLILQDKNGAVVQTLTYKGEPSPAQQFLRISEILFAPAAASGELEYLVLKNVGPEPLNLYGVHFTNGITFTFTNTTILAPSAKIYIAQNPSAFRDYYGEVEMLDGPFIGQLNNSGETIQLDDASGEKIVDVTYSGSWYPATAPSSGHSLMLGSDAISYTRFSDKTSWVPSPTPGGTAAASHAWESWRTNHFTTAELNDNSISAAEADPDQDGASNQAEFIAGTDPRNSGSRLQLDLLRFDATTLLLKFNGSFGRLYSVSTSESLTGPWTTVESLPRVAESGPVQLIIRPPTEARPRFYRLETAF